MAAGFFDAGGLFEGLFGKSSSSSSNQSGTQNSTGTNTVNQSGTQTSAQGQTQAGTQKNTGTTDQTQTGGSTAAGSQAQTQKTTTLDPAIQALLTHLLPSLSANVSDASSGPNANVTGLQALATLLSGRAGGSNNVDKQVSDAQAVARQSFDIGTQSQINQTKQQIGSTGNSFSALLDQRGQVDLATNLANIDSTTRAQARSQDTNDALAAIQALSTAQGAQTSSTSTPIAQLLSVVQALTGVNTESNVAGSTTSTQDTLSKLLGSTTSDTTSIVDTLSKLLSTSDTSGKSTSTENVNTTANANQKSQSGGILGLINGLF